MLRLAGAALIFAASLAAGLCAAGMYRTRVIQLEAFHSLIVHIGRQIDSCLVPLDRIYAAYRDPVLERCGFLAELRRSGGEAALSACGYRLLLSDTEIHELTAFFMGLGRHSAEEEPRHCAYFSARIGELAEKARGELAAKTRLCRAFGMLLGIMLAVILL
ncbi:MAG: stage III sporulation protein AB [Clostridia bacterium]|nr:stage III sporulation protein AB [Clostridia bacterium]